MFVQYRKDVPVKFNCGRYLPGIYRPGERAAEVLQ
jgi:hypothetical protein